MHLHHLDREAVSSVVVTTQTPIAEALKLMSEKSMRLVVVKDEAGAFWGVLADGDVRRFIATGKGIDEPVKLAGNSRPTVIDKAMPNAKILEILDDRQIEYLPHVKNGELLGLYALLPWRQKGAASVVVMAGGLGTRLRPMTDNCPKPLIKVGGVPILTHSIKRLVAQGFDDFTLCVNYLGDMIVDQYGNGHKLGANIRYVHEEKRLGTGGALSLIDHTLTDSILVMNGDVISDLDVADALEQHRLNGWMATMVVRQHSIAVPYGVVRISPEAEYLSADEKPVYKFLINTGTYILRKEALKLIPKNTFFDLPNLFETLREKQLPCGTYLHEGQWIDIGNKSELDRANYLFKSKGSF